jgi:hypothetical protein
MRTIGAFLLGVALAATLSAHAQTDPCGSSIYRSGVDEFARQYEQPKEQYEAPRLLITPPGSKDCFGYGTFADCR